MRGQWERVAVLTTVGQGRGRGHHRQPGDTPCTPGQGEGEASGEAERAWKRVHRSRPCLGGNPVVSWQLGEAMLQPKKVLMRRGRSTIRGCNCVNLLWAVLKSKGAEVSVAIWPLIG